MKSRSINTTLLTTMVVLALAHGLAAQSTSQDFPTPITSNEVSGTIKARDLGDSRLTTYYYALNGDQGDLFINLVTRNLTGDIDVFTLNGSRPMTKIVVYADYGEAETGRAIYLRKSEKLLLRIQGRTPNDDDATFRLKFAGSFVALRAEDVASAPELPKVTAENRGSVRVNSVGTILPPPPRPAEPVEDKAKPETETVAKSDKTEDPKLAETEKPVEPDVTKPKAELVVTDPVRPEADRKAPTRRRVSASRGRNPIRSTPEDKEKEKRSAETVGATERPDVEKPAVEKTAEKLDEEKRVADKESSKEPPFRTLTNDRRVRAPKKPPEPDPMESINLVVRFKDGTTLEKRMSEVSRFSVDKGVLTILLKDKSVTRYAIVDVSKVTIE